MKQGKSWFADGLRFECTQCGRCCGGSPGTVLISEGELQAMAASLELTRESFAERYTRRLPSGRLSLLEKSNYDCVFYEPGAGCTIYAQRPRQCRSWPFWRGNLATRAHWEEAALECPGMDQGRLHTEAEIQSSAASDGTMGFIAKLKRR